MAIISHKSWHNFLLVIDGIKALLKDCAARSFVPSNFQHVPVYTAYNENVHDGLQNMKNKQTKTEKQVTPPVKLALTQTCIHIS